MCAWAGSHGAASSIHVRQRREQRQAQEVKVACRMATECTRPQREPEDRSTDIVRKWEPGPRKAAATEFECPPRVAFTPPPAPPRRAPRACVRRRRAPRVPTWHEGICCAYALQRYARRYRAGVQRTPCRRAVRGNGYVCVCVSKVCVCATSRLEPMDKKNVPVSSNPRMSPPRHCMSFMFREEE